MFKPLLKYTFIAFVWKRYKSIILSSLFLLLFIFFVVIIHNDYVRYSEKTGEQAQLAFSFLLKWGVIAAALLIYILYVKVLLRVKPKKNKVSSNDSQVDSFENIRSKNKLASKADKIISPEK